MAAAIAMPNGKMRIPDRAFSPTEVESNGSGAPLLALLHRFAGEPQFLEGQLRSMAAFNTPAMYREASFARRSGVGDGLRRELRHAGPMYQPISRVCLPAPILSDRPTIHSTAGRDRHVGGNHD